MSNDLPSVSAENALKVADLLPAFEIAGLGKGVAADACSMLRSLAAERDELASRVAELEGAAKLVLAWYEAEENHGDTSFMQRVEMCRESEDALRAALGVSKGGA